MTTLLDDVDSSVPSVSFEADDAMMNEALFSASVLEYSFCASPTGVFEEMQSTIKPKMKQPINFVLHQVWPDEDDMALIDPTAIQDDIVYSQELVPDVCLSTSMFRDEEEDKQLEFFRKVHEPIQYNSGAATKAVFGPIKEKASSKRKKKTSRRSSSRKGKQKTVKKKSKKPTKRSSKSKHKSKRVKKQEKEDLDFDSLSKRLLSALERSYHSQELYYRVLSSNEKETDKVSEKPKEQDDEKEESTQPVGAEKVAKDTKEEIEKETNLGSKALLEMMKKSSASRRDLLRSWTSTANQQQGRPRRMSNPLF